MVGCVTFRYVRFYGGFAVLPVSTSKVDTGSTGQIYTFFYVSDEEYVCMQNTGAPVVIMSGLSVARNNGGLRYLSVRRFLWWFRGTGGVDIKSRHRKYRANVHIFVRERGRVCMQNTYCNNFRNFMTISIREYVCKIFPDKCPLSRKHTILKIQTYITVYYYVLYF